VGRTFHLVLATDLQSFAKLNDKIEKLSATVSDADLPLKGQSAQSTDPFELDRRVGEIIENRNRYNGGTRDSYAFCQAVIKGDEVFR
jgi:hypothetical protein